MANSPVSIRRLLKDVPLIGIDVDWPNAHWLWVPFIAFDPKRLPDVKDLKFHVGLIDGIVCDTGSASHEYLRNHPEVQYSLLPRCMGKDFFPYDEAAFAKKGLGALANTPIDWSTTAMEFYVDYRFLHFRGGSGLHPEIRHIELADFMKKMVP